METRRDEDDRCAAPLTARAPDATEKSLCSFSVCTNPVFVVGCPRSGTSVLAHSLAQHAALWLGEESDFLGPLIRHVRDVHAFGTQRGKFHWLSAQGVTYEELLQYIGMGINALYTQRSGGLRWIEQTPQYTLYLPYMKRMFPGACFLHILRDAGDVVLSMIRSGFDTAWAKDFEEACRTWVRFVKAALDFESANPGRVLRVKHEELVNEREEGFRRILSFLGLPYDSSVTKLLGQGRMNSSFGGDEKARPRWKDAFSDRQKARLLDLCGTLLNRLGYETEVAPRPLHVHADKTHATERDRPAHLQVQDRPTFEIPVDPTGTQCSERAGSRVVRPLPSRGDLRNLADRLTEVGESLFSRGHHAEALDLFQCVADVAPESAVNWNNLGVTLAQTGQWSDSLDAFRMATEIDSSFSVARDNLLQVAKLQGGQPDELRDLRQRMKGDWNRRALENALHYVKSDQQDWDIESFFLTGKGDVRRYILDDLEFLCGGRLPSELHLLEIGCGVGRMSRHLADVFGKVTSIDVSEEMIRRAKHYHPDKPNLEFFETDGSSLSQFPDDCFDIAFSFIVFQHVPSKAVLLNYFEEIRRVVKPGGRVKFQVHGVTSPEYARVRKNTWLGVSFSEEEMRRLSDGLDFRVAGMTGMGTQYFWVKWRVPEENVRETLNALPPTETGTQA